MKKLKYLIVLLAAVLIIPFSVYAEGEDDEYEYEYQEASEGAREVEETSEESVSKKVNVYLFRGEGCPHCQEAEEWFKSIEEEYGSFFELIDYETWYNEENAELMQKVADARGETAEGVPYIIIGNKSWNGFAESYTDEIIEQIMSVFSQDVSERYDIMTYLPLIDSGEIAKDKESNDVLALILIIIVSGGIVFGIYQARKHAN